MSNTLAYRGYTAACAQLGSQPEKPASGRLMLRVAPTVHAAALKAAAHLPVARSVAQGKGRHA
ncbi:toxin-antitoxin system HicB family antitoxin [Sphaerotilus sp.]|uniref:toxin-antitoxin system HicB family antitoxin n=1 Tax=Sphaerotilus sp. TaxID=2093942 RepID=UPI00286E1D37|nr:toxin-antitoxin system HicB family antitoxin [Sphaerotilus sp.]